MNRETANRRAEEFVNERIRGILDQINDLKEGIASDSKSTAGDKHETGRAMAQLEQEKLALQLLQLQEHLHTIQLAGKMNAGEIIGFGSVVKTAKGWFYLSAGIGAIPDETPFFCLSMKTPMGQALLGKRAGESTMLNGQPVTIESHC